MEKVYISKSKIGKGLFANKDISKGENIFELKGKLIKLDVDLNIPDKIRNNSIRYDEERYLRPSKNFWDFINHSCNPNAAIKKIRNKLYLFSLKKIKNGSEIFFDYSTNLADDDIWKMKCKCSNKDCRKTISKFSSLNEGLKKKYIKSGAVPKYILNISN